MVKGEGTAWDGIFKQSELAEDEVCQFTGDFYDFTYGFIPIKKKTKKKNTTLFWISQKLGIWKKGKAYQTPEKQTAYNGKSSSHSGVGQC